MKLEDQVCSLELSKKLKELGVKQESLFYWLKFRHSDKAKVYSFNPNNCPPEAQRELEWFVSAFTASELGEILNKRNGALMFNFVRPNKTWFVAPKGRIPHFYGKTMADCLAKMLIFMIKNKLLKIKK